LIVGAGNVRVLLVRELVIQPVRFALVIVAAQYGLAAVAWSIVATYTLSFYVNQLAVRKVFGIGFRDVLYQSATPALITALTASVLLGTKLIMAQLQAPPLWTLLSGFAVGAPAYLAALVVTQSSLVGELTGFARRLRPRRS
jgi:hypothetical protein